MDCEFGRGTRRRPIGLDYGVAKDAGAGKLKHSAKGISHSGRTDVRRQGKDERGQMS